MKEKLISEDEVKRMSPIFRGSLGNTLIKIGMRITGMNKVNKVYDDSKMYEGVEFCNHLINDIGVKVVYHNREVLNQFENKPFITVSNHAYGHIDGIIAIAAVGAIRSDYKMMVNYVLSLIDTMSMHFISVNPYQSGKLAKKSSVEGVKQSIEHLRDGHPLGFFPAGAVSKTKIRHGRLMVEDREWQPTVIKLIRASKTPVIPIYFSGKNSWFFNILDLIDWRLRSLRLGHEVTNKRGKTINVRFGDPIMPLDMDKYQSLAELGDFLKQKTYDLAQPQDK